MSKWHRRSVRWSWSVSVLAAIGLGLGLTAVSASASPSTLALDRFGDRPMVPVDPAGIAGQVAPQLVNISTRFGYNNAVGAGTGIIIDPGGVILTHNPVVF